jgi:hypothetical protein
MNRPVTLYLDAELYELMQQKYPKKISEFFNDVMRDTLLVASKEKEVTDIKQEAEQLDVQMSIMKLKKERLMTEALKIEQDTERERTDFEKTNQLKKQTCSKCKQIKEEKEITHYGGTCKNCFIAGDNKELSKKFMESE